MVPRSNLTGMCSISLSYRRIDNIYGEPQICVDKAGSLRYLCSNVWEGEKELYKARPSPSRSPQKASLPLLVVAGCPGRGISVRPAILLSSGGPPEGYVSDPALHVFSDATSGTADRGITCQSYQEQRAASRRRLEGDKPLRRNDGHAGR